MERSEIRDRRSRIALRSMRATVSFNPSPTLWLRPRAARLEAAKRTIEQTRRETAELAEQIRASKETIAKSEKVLARLKALFPDLEDTKPEDSV